MFAATLLKRSSPVIEVYSTFIVSNDSRAFCVRIESIIDSEMIGVYDDQSEESRYVCRYDFHSDQDRWYNRRRIKLELDLTEWSVSGTSKPDSNLKGVYPYYFPYQFVSGAVRLFYIE